jgi:hypothetical protein
MHLDRQHTWAWLPELDWRLRIGGREPENSPAKVYRADGDARAGVCVLAPAVRAAVFLGKILALHCMHACRFRSLPSSAREEFDKFHFGR